MSNEQRQSNQQRGLALVTGGSGGIGSACCRELAAVGFQVVIHYSSGEEAAKRLQAELPGSITIQADLSKIEEIDRLYEQVKSAGTLTVLVNNAGITRDGPLLSAKVSDFDDVVNLNMKSTWYLTKRLSRLMARKSYGRIINISSVVGCTGNPGQSVYAMTKAAINNFTKVAAIELAGFNILVNAVAPGFIDTQMTQEIPQEAKDRILSQIFLGRMGNAIEVAKMVRFLATEGDYCTGSLFHVNGGMYGA